ncbi:MAG TPA: hypothetical protein VE198_12985, partial [Actinoallomurus sp.]|nr:hypothetical protein [Actinoallomurus sp.]
MNPSDARCGTLAGGRGGARCRSSGESIGPHHGGGHDDPSARAGKRAGVGMVVFDDDKSAGGPSL